MGTISNHKSCYNNTVHHYTTYYKTWEQSVTTAAVPMGCRMLCSDAQCCYYSSCGYWLFPCFVVCCVVMYSVANNIRQNMGTICNHSSCYNNTVHHYTTYDIPWEQSVTTRYVITTLCITTQHTFPCFVVCCVVMYSVIITALLATDCSHVL
jgi:hypothetical protein